MLLSGSTEEFVFDQREVATQYNVSGYESGACFGLVANWLAEKMGDSNSLSASLGRMVAGDERAFRGPPNLSNSAEILQKGLDLQNIYETSFLKNGNIRGENAMREVFEKAGLAVNEIKSVKANSPEGGTLIRKRSVWNTPEPDIQSSLTAAAGMVEKGTGVMVSCVVGNGTHAIGLYKSHGNNLHFFDPNIGVHKVHDVSEFVQAWSEYYDKKKSTLSLDTSSETFMYVNPHLEINKMIPQARSNIVEDASRSVGENFWKETASRAPSGSQSTSQQSQTQSQKAQTRTGPIL